MIAIPYWFLGRGVGLVRDALGIGVVVGTLLAVFLASFGFLISVFASSNRVSLSPSLLVLFALFVPTQLPTAAQQGWAGDLLLARTRLPPASTTWGRSSRTVMRGARTPPGSCPRSWLPSSSRPRRSS